MLAGIGRLAAGWAILLFLLSGLLLIGETPGTPEFVVTLFTMCLGLFLGALVLVVTLLLRRSQRRGHAE
ncbi:MAG TPA: hypothetical protein VIM10_08065 [Actinopolymorphaceae bacterium]|jgi:hypothetical protein